MPPLSEYYTEATSALQPELSIPFPMTSTKTVPDLLAQRPKRADALRNYEKLIAAAREAFAEKDAAASLEDIARRAGVGIGTLYRHFPTRQALLEATYVEEIETMSRIDVAGLPPGEALDRWLREFATYATTKRALADELMQYISHDSEVFAQCRAALIDAGEALLREAQDAGLVRADANFIDVARMVGGIATIPAADEGQVERILEMALDGLRVQPATP
jgi:AcrR family transcriptional regulator